MKYLFKHTTADRLAFLLILFAPLCSAFQTQPSSPVVVSARMEKGALVYKVNGKPVEDSKENSLLTNLARIAKTRGNKVSVFIIIDVHAPFTEVGKLETALDKVGMTHSRRLFVTDFHDSTMNELHWDETSVPIPPN